MSVLYKALQKAEKENEQRQTSVSGQGFDPGRLAGSGAIKLAGGRNVNWRIAAFAGVGVVAVAIGGAFLLMPQQPAQHPQVATLTPPATTPKPAASPAVPPAPAMAPAGADAQAAPATPPAEAPQIASAEPPAAVPAPAVVAAPKETAALPASASPPAAAPVVVAAATPVPAAPPSPSPTAAPPPTTAAVPPITAAAPAASIKVSAPPSAPAKLPPIPADSPAQALSPPIAISRADFALSGVGNAVQVRQVSKDAQDNVGAGYTALLRGEYDTALGFYDRALEKEPASVLGLLGRGASLQKLQRFDEAQAAYAKALKIDPENREALSNVTAIIGERSPAEALNRLLDLEKDYPGFSPIKAQIGLIYAKMGTMEQAADYLRRAIALTPQSAMYQYNLALVLDHMGLREQAIAGYESVLGAIGAGAAPPELSSTDIERRVRYLRVK